MTAHRRPAAACGRWLTRRARLLPLLLQLPTPLIAGALRGRGAGRRGCPGASRLPALAAPAAGACVLAPRCLADRASRFGRDTGCALLAAMLAIKPAETFSLRDARSLIGFALFAPFATFLLDQGPLTLALGAGRRCCARWSPCSAWPTWNPAYAVQHGRRAGAAARPSARLVAIGLPLALAASGCSRAWLRRCGACRNARWAGPACPTA